LHEVAGLGGIVPEIGVGGFLFEVFYKAMFSGDVKETSPCQLLWIGVFQFFLEVLVTYKQYIKMKKKVSPQSQTNQFPHLR